MSRGRDRGHRSGRGSLFPCEIARVPGSLAFCLRQFGLLPGGSRSSSRFFGLRPLERLLLLRGEQGGLPLFAGGGFLCETAGQPGGRSGLIHRWLGPQLVENTRPGARGCAYALLKTWFLIS